MATESAIRLIGTTGAGSWPPSKDSMAYNSSPGNLAGEELGFIANGSRIYGGWRESLPNRSGSAPPSMEGSLAALGHLIGQQNGSFEASLGNLGSATDGSRSEELLRSDPAYLEYYSSKVNLNPRLPPPLISREGRRLMHRVGKVGGEWRMVSLDDSSKGSLFLSRSTLSTHKEEPEDDRSPRLDSSGGAPEDVQYVSGRNTSNPESSSMNLVNFMQENFPRNQSSLYDNSPCNGDSNEEGGAVYSCISLSNSSSLDIGKPSELSACPVDIHSWRPRPVISPLSTTSSSNNLSASSIPSSSCSDSNATLQPFQQGKSSTDIKPANVATASGTIAAELDTVNSDMKALKISLDGHGNQPVKPQWQHSAPPQHGSSFVVQGDPIHMIPQGAHLPQVAIVDNFSQTPLKLPSGDVQPALHSSGMSTPFYTPNSFGNPFYQNLQPSSLFTPQYGIGGYPLNTSFVPPVISSYSPHGSVATPLDNPINPNFGGRLSGFPSAGNFTTGTEFMQPYKIYGQLGVTMQPSVPDPNYVHFFQHPSLQPYAGGSQYNTMAPRVNVGANLADSFDPQKVVSPATFPSEQKFQLPRSGSSTSPPARKGGTVIPSYQGSSPYIGIQMPYPAGSVFQGQPLSGSYTPRRGNETVRFQSTSRNMVASTGLPGLRGREKFDEPKSCSFLEELKSNRARRVELSDIAGRIVEYSADQHGSRFIQQKLENCSVEEKASVFQEVLPHASSLMTDVFGNYVIQKFFEHGSPEQRQELADKLVGHILPLSLQMYGCRVIQKALEVIELDQKTKLVRELDGHVMRCVRDQNGNHVIQKCIECVPTEHIGFIISAFRGQVANLSIHPYGCRVIQRVLEHCSGDSQGQCIVDEILQSACILAQDQYGNYVTQHVLERGNGHERSQIIRKLAGQVVNMSQNKFASNVIEKCFEHGDAAERELLIREIVEQTEGNDNLLVMMKDQFANYVVQKILETCNEKQREILLGRIKGHLQALRKYTYGKHIVSRVEQLCGEGADESES